MVRKVIILIVLIFAVRFSASAQYFSEHYSADQRKALLYASKVQTYKKMRTAGIILGVAGAVLTTAGIAKADADDMNNALAKYSGGLNVPAGDPEGQRGALMVMLGVPMSVAGIVLGIIGSRKVRSYSEKLDKITVDLSYSPQRKGVMLTYRF